MITLDYTGLDSLLAKALTEAEHEIAMLYQENLALKEVIVELKKKLDNREY